MYRNSTVGSLPLGLSRRLLAQCSSLLACVLVFCGLALFGGSSLEAQDTAGGGIQGTITDPKGDGVPKAQVTATNTDTGVQTTKLTGSTGTYSISPLQPGPYIVEVVATGFQRLLQENVTIDASQNLGLNLKLTVGGETTTVTITDAPPFINTTDSTLGGTIENELYANLPITMNGAARDPTAFQYLMPGVQENPADNNGTGSNNGNSGIYGGTGQTNLNENYLEGVPVSNIAQQGSSNPIANAVSVDAVDQFSVQTSTASSSFGGAGSTNYTIKAGGNQFHGSAVDYIRNTDFDSWGYFSKVPASSGFAEKPGEHQNNYDMSLGGPIFKDKLFFFGDYAGFRYTKISNTPQYITIPTCAERGQGPTTDGKHCGAFYSDHGGDFTDVLGTSTANIVNPVLGSFGSRPPFQGTVNGVPTYNVIELPYMSSISTYLESALPAPTNLSTFSNYLASLPQANNNYSVDARLDYTLNSRNKFSLVAVGGNVGYGGAPFYSTQTQLPIPYAAGQFTNQKTASGVFSYVYIISQTLINTMKYAYSRNWGQGFSITQGTKYNSTAAGINNLPQGNAASSMPVVSFSQDNGPTAPFGWASTANTGPKATNSYVVQDALQWIKNRHNITFGAQISWDETNGGNYGGFSNTLNLSYHAYDTETGTTNTGVNGDTYASFLVGAVYSGSVGTQSIQDVGARYRPIEPYIQDSWQVSPKLTLDLGLRYSYLQPYHEVKNRLAFLNVHIINPIAGVPGVLMYAGTPSLAEFPAIAATSTTPAESSQQLYNEYSPYMCRCRTPVKPYNQNLQPRIGFSYAYTPQTVFAGGFAVNLTHAGGVGGNAGATQGTGNNGEFAITSSVSQNGSTSDPGFFLNPGLTALGASPHAALTPPIQGLINPQVNGVSGASIACLSATVPCSPYSAIMPYTVPSIAVNPLATTGNYEFTSYFADHLNDYGCPSSDGFSCQSQGVNFADPYYGGRGPQFITYNFHVQQMINKKAVLTVAYSGSQTHFLPGGAGRGPATNAASPDYAEEYLAGLGGTALPTGFTVPYPRFAGSNATLYQALRPFPQFGGMSDLWGDTGNANYNALQISVIQRPWHNLSGFVNYTRAKEIDDTGNHRTQYGVGPQDGNFVKNYRTGWIDRGLGTSNQTNAFNLTWVYSFPIGRGQAFFATNRIAGLIGGGWQLSGIYRYRDGTPIQVVNGAGCMTNSTAGQGTCYPDYVPGFNKSQIRINGRWGRGPGANAANLNSIGYINPNGFECPDSSPQNTTFTCGGTNEPNTTYKLGNLARTAPYGLTGPGWWDIQLGLRRTFNVRETATLHLTFQVEADVDNATNSTFFNLANSSTTNGAFGAVGGQNKSIQPRDWQFAGRFRF
jgi:hypothetical protein